VRLARTGASTKTLAQSGIEALTLTMQQESTGRKRRRAIADGGQSNKLKRFQ